MNKSIYDVKQINLLPEHLRGTNEAIALSTAIDKQFVKLLKHLDILNLYASPKVCPEKYLDILADEISLPYYDRNLDVVTKRQLLENGISYHRRNGTPSAVEDLINIVFGDGKVMEWFEYDGEPYHFKVTTSNPEATTTKAVEFFRAVNSYKNLRSVLEKIEIESNSNHSLFSGAAIHYADEYTVRQVI